MEDIPRVTTGAMRGLGVVLPLGGWLYPIDTGKTAGDPENPARTLMIGGEGNKLVRPRVARAKCVSARSGG